MRVEVYSDKYFNDVVKVVEDFYTQYLTDQYSDISREVIAQTIEHHKDNIFLLLSDCDCVGVLAGIEIQSKLNSQRFFQEFMWYVDPDFGSHGFYFIERVTEILKLRGFSSIIMSVVESPKSNRISGIYERMGFKKMETHFMRAV